MLNDEFYRIQRAINRYADAKVRADIGARYEGRPDHDMTCHGTPLRPGS